MKKIFFIIIFTILFIFDICPLKAMEKNDDFIIDFNNKNEESNNKEFVIKKRLDGSNYLTLEDGSTFYSELIAPKIILNINNKNITITTNWTNDNNLIQKYSGTAVFFASRKNKNVKIIENTLDPSGGKVKIPKYPYDIFIAMSYIVDKYNNIYYTITDQYFFENK